MTTTPTVLEVLESLHLTEYYDVLVKQGFDTHQAFELLSESDLDAMGIIKLGHRKLLLHVVKADKLAHRKRKTVSFREPEPKQLRGKSDGNDAVGLDAKEIADSDNDAVEDRQSRAPPITPEGTLEIDLDEDAASDNDTATAATTTATTTTTANITASIETQNSYDNIAYTLAPEPCDDDADAVSTAVPSPRLDPRVRASASASPLAVNSSTASMKRSASADVMPASSSSTSIARTTAPSPLASMAGKPEKLSWSKSFFVRALARDVPYDNELPVLIKMPAIELLLVRHGESEANVDHSLYQKIADSAVPLSDRGKQQAATAGERIAEHFDARFHVDGKVQRPANFHCRLWNSCYKRARQTADIIFKESKGWISDQREDILIGEQQFGLFEGVDWSTGQLDSIYPNEITYYRKASKHAGRFWAKVPLGESRMDVCLRVKQFFGTLHRDAVRHGITNVVIVSHGVTLRAILMMWLHLSPEWLELEPNPQNCSIRLITNCMDGGFLHGGHEHPRKDLLINDNNVHV